MKEERCRDGCRTSLLIAGGVLVPAIFHTLLLPCHPYITIHFVEMIFPLVIIIIIIIPLSVLQYAKIHIHCLRLVAIGYEHVCCHGNDNCEVHVCAKFCCHAPYYHLRII